MDIRKIARIIVNVGAIALIVLQRPELGQMVPPEWAPSILTAVGVVNLVLSAVRWLAEGQAAA